MPPEADASSAGEAATPEGSRLALVAATTVTMVAFAANSLLTRAALAEGRIDAASFAALRLASGALVLGFLLHWRRRRDGGARPSPLDRWAVLALLAYVLPFSWAYRHVEAGVGALILFGAVQVTMVGAGLLAGERPSWPVWVGSAIALGGLAYLGWPGEGAPPVAGSVAMTVAGVAWGAYSLRGRRVDSPLAATARNFAWASGPALLVAASLHWPGTGDPTVAAEGSSFLAGWRSAWAPAPIYGGGVLLAVASGALASGLGYALWYRTVPRLSRTTAAVVQLSVPPIALLASVALLGEALSLKTTVASALILGGVGLAVSARSGAAPRTR